MASVKNKLLELFGQLNNAEQESLLEYAEFMVSRSDHAQQQKITEPLDIPRPDEESVVGAMRRLSETYPMLNRDKLLHEAAGCMSEHVMQGKEAKLVIDDLEILFARHFQALQKSTD